MKCGFCGREVAKGALECPYCHYRFEVDAQVLTPNERDAFDGVTIEEDGSIVDNKNVTAGDQGYGRDNAQGQGRGYHNGGYSQQQAPGIKVHTFGCGSSILMTLLILGGILALFFLFAANLYCFRCHWRCGSVYFKVIYVM